MMDSNNLNLETKWSHLQGLINQMKPDKLNSELESRGKKTKGVPDVLKARLKNAVLQEKLKMNNSEDISMQAIRKRIRDRPALPRYVCVMDIEATCVENDETFPHEIIELPFVVVDRELCKVVCEKQFFVRPTYNPKLSDFCTNLTGISQEVVSQAPTFAQVLDEVNDFLLKSDVWGTVTAGGSGRSFCIATDGPWDVRDFLRMQCELSQVKMPQGFHKWINVRKHFRKCYGIRGGIQRMLESLGLSFEGRAHCGLDDSRNIARIVIQMLEDGHELTLNDSLDAYDSVRLRRLRAMVQNKTIKYPTLQL